MRIRVIPARPLLTATGAGAVCLLVALVVAIPVTTVSWGATAWIALLAAAATVDYRISRQRGARRRRG
jgi:hypothetical protein